MLLAQYTCRSAIVLVLLALFQPSAGKWPPFSRGTHQGIDHSLFPKTEAQIEGDRDAFFKVFASDKLELLASGFQWTEGPLWQAPSWLLFSDTIDGRLWRFRTPPNWKLEVVLEDAGGATVSTCGDLAEPGSNGLAQHPTEERTVLMAQHCVHRISALDLDTHELRIIVDRAPGGERLNSPNDLVVGPDGTHVYFTDPPYGFLEQARFGDLPYLDEKAGLRGIYRAPLSGGNGKAELLDAGFSRPNGIAFSADGQRLFVSECCQGTHNETCQQGMHRFVAFNVASDGRRLTDRSEILIDLRGKPGAEKGCADGFKVDPQSGLLIASCASGLCLVDFDGSGLVARLFLDWKLSNVALGGDGFAYLTGQQGVWRLPLNTDRDEL